jgi:hypothetical protein
MKNDSAPKCDMCGEAILYRNVVGVCTRNKDCFKENKNRRQKLVYINKYGDPEHPELHTKTQQENRRRNAEYKQTMKKEGRVFSNPWQIKDDGIIDEIAIQIAVQGTRPVRLTHSERKIVLLKLLQMGCGLTEIREHMHFSGKKLLDMIDELDWEIVHSDLDRTQPRIPMPKCRPWATALEMS